MAEETQNQTLDETLNKTDFGQVINENKKLILTVGAIIVVLVFAYSLYKQKDTETYNANLDAAYEFRVSTLDAYNTKKIKVDEFLKKVAGMNKAIEGEPSLLPAVLLASTNLSKEGKLTDSLSLLDNWKKHFGNNTYNAYFISLRRAAVLEDLNKNEDALAELDTLKKSSINLLKAKVLMDMARIQTVLGQKEKAKENLDIVVKDYEGSDEAKLAQYELAKLSN